MRSLVPPFATYGPRLLARFFPDMLWRVDTDERVAYLTFDDGPTSSITGDLLDLLARYDARATCFLIGHHANKHPRLVRAIRQGGHRIGNHTHTHPDAWRSPSERIVGELNRTTRLLQDLARVPVRLMRPPYGHFTGAMRTWCAKNEQRMVMWDVMPGDFLGTATTRGIERFILKTIRPGSVIVLHDNPIVEGITLPALRAVLPALAREGWRFEAL